MVFSLINGLFYVTHVKYFILLYILLNNAILPSSVIHMMNLYKIIIQNETSKKFHYFCHYNSSVLKASGNPWHILGSTSIKVICLLGESFHQNAYRRHFTFE